MKLKRIYEAAPSDLMPDTRDPYVGSGVPESPAPEPEPEPQPEAPAAEPGPPGTIDDLLDTDTDEIDFDVEAPGLVPPAPPEPEPSEMEMLDWVEQESTDRRDKTFAHRQGFNLRIRQTNIDQNKWLAQLFVDGKILDSGFITVPSQEDPSAYIQGVADGMLKIDPSTPGTELPPEQPDPVGYGPPEMADAPYPWQ